MKKRSLLTSVVASSVLVGVMMFSGCGGSNASVSPSLPSLDGNDKTASATAKVVADSNGNLNQTVSLISDNKKAKVAQITFTKVLKGDGTPACTNVSDDCTIKAKQISACTIDKSDEAFEKAKDHVLELIDEVGDRYDAENDMIVFGGTLSISAEGFDKCTMALDINMIKCGSAFGKDGNPINKTGFSNEGHIVDVYVEDADGNGEWITDIRIKDGKILIPSSKLTNIELPAKFTFYSIKDANKDNTTGITGGTGSGGYGG